MEKARPMTDTETIIDRESTRRRNIGDHERSSEEHSRVAAN